MCGAASAFGSEESERGHKRRHRGSGRPTRRRRATSRSWPSATCGCTSRGWAPTRTTRCRSSCAARAATSTTSTATATWTASSALFCVNAGHGRAELGEAAAAPGAGARLLHQLELRAPARDRARRADRVARAGRPEPRVLHLRRLRGGRVRLEAGPQLPPAPRRRAAHEADRPRARLPRHLAGRAGRHRPHRRCARRSSRSRRAAATCRTRTATAGPRTATRSGPPTRSRSGSCSRARRRSPR